MDHRSSPQAGGAGSPHHHLLTLLPLSCKIIAVGRGRQFNAMKTARLRAQRNKFPAATGNVRASAVCITTAPTMTF